VRQASASGCGAGGDAVAGPKPPSGALRVGEQQIAILKALERIEQRIVGLPLRLHRFDLREEPPSFSAPSDLMKGLGEPHAIAHR
jgi:hypothetical protein